MKKQLKALALTIALITTTACGAKEAQVEETKVTAVETTVAKEAKVANIEAPKGETREVKEGQTNFLIPQTVELKDTEEIAVEETVAIETTIEAVVASDEIIVEEKEEIKDVAIEQAPVVEEVKLAKTNKKPAASIDLVSRTSESTSLPNTVENTVAAAVAVEETVVEEAIVEETVVENQTYASEANEATPAVVEGGLTVKSPSAEAVKTYWTNYQSGAANTADFFGLQLVNQEDVHAVMPNANLNQLNLGQVSQAAQLDALHIANTARYASGLNEMTLGNDQAAYAQAATMVNRANLAVSHYPGQPAGLDANVYQSGAHGAANSNLAASFGLLDSVVEYLKDDLGAENQLEAGHRRWILNPSATTTGFGQTEEFNAMYVNNNDYAGQNANQVVAYPAETAISEFHSASSSLSIQFGENFDITNATVTVTDLATGQVNTNYHIDQSFKGNGRAITFGNGMNYAPGTKLAVKVNGVTKNGVAYPVEYTINYCSII